MLLLGLCFTGLPEATAQDPVLFTFSPPDEKWTVTTRWDYRVRLDGRYLGFANRELREVFIRGESLPGAWEVVGEARLLGATKKNGVPVAARLEDSENLRFLLGHDGTVLEADDGYPRLRGFPTFPEQELREGDYWEAPLDILITGPNGERGVLNQIAAYRYVGKKPYNGRPAHYFDVSWAIRYRGYRPDLAPFLSGVEGSHRVSLVVDAETMAPIMARDNLSERWQWADSRVEQRDGFALIFWKGVPPLDRGGLIEEFADRFPGLVEGDRGSAGSEPGGGPGSSGRGGAGSGDSADDGVNGRNGPAEGIVFVDEETALDEGGDIVIRETPRGVSVTLRNLHFQPDLAELVPGEEAVLDELAAILASVAYRTILVRGHTADVGRPVDQKNLSEQRAKTIADEVARRGIDPRRLIYEGVGATEPVAPNDSEEGRRRNRRVELIILED